eukprot:2218976-Rhodomonas_salina.1
MPVKTTTSILANCLQQAAENNKMDRRIQKTVQDANTKEAMIDTAKYLVKVKKIPITQFLLATEEMDKNSNAMQIVDTGCTVVDIVATNVLATIQDDCDRDAFNDFINEDIVNDIVLPHLTMLSCTMDASATDPFSLHARKGVGSRGPQTC